jgi:hypothetical protein
LQGPGIRLTLPELARLRSDYFLIPFVVIALCLFACSQENAGRRNSSRHLNLRSSSLRLERGEFLDWPPSNFRFS